MFNDREIEKLIKIIEHYYGTNIDQIIEEDKDIDSIIYKLENLTTF